ncbi:beta-ketoacyl-[acyl-carrier-protein] synthase family protein [Polyangium mundeleinium]|uniref:Beta-ketoacyl-[acyl-carrier-protein] synthase family protein n=1 Tax=Polyangium mundeleinium TaxID=2995306 RepID=A0ABT5F099_9BACT|nr:beta-ketoacyl-[acyl-carrier-protein] synthase family protein [Polyangium mundeleinium]MDC0746592.1 beta-ketoacyl-[acyl-carrier-protein] synthase family protein [Polyangium mundeleinium]
MRIWVTGIGVVSPLGRGAGVTMDRLLAGDRAFGELSIFHLPDMRTRLAAEVPGISAAEVAPEGDAEAWSRTDAMSVLAVREALAQAGVAPAAGPIDLIVGGTTAGMYETEDLLAELSRDADAIKPLRAMLTHPLSSTADHVRAAVGPFRRVRSLCSACSSGANALLLAAAWIRAGVSPCVVAGGADGLCRLTYTGFGALSAVDPNPCRPFDKRRAGLNLGEGAAFLVLEPEDASRARGVTRPIAELVGWGVGAEAHHITNPEREGRTAARVMQAALSKASLSPADIDHVNAHGTATPLNDSMEAAAIRACFGPDAERVLVSSVKGQIGHTLGAAGAIEAAVSVMTIARGEIPPTQGLEEVDPACPLMHATRATKADVRAVMSNSFGFGGTDTSLVFAAPGVFPAPQAPPRRAVVVVSAATIGPLGVLGARENDVYLEPGPPPAPGPIHFNAADHLDVGRARRLDRAGRLSAVAIQRALRDAGLDPLDPSIGVEVGAILGAAFGSVDGSTAFMRRIYEKGVKFASPADFPNLVPSSPVGHASIYLGLRGPVFAVADLGVTAECAVVTAADLIAVGEGEVLAAGSVEEASPMIERCLGPICSGETRGVRSEGASAILLEAEEHAKARGIRPLARLPWWTSWRGAGEGALDAVPAPPHRAAVLTGQEDLPPGLRLPEAWARVPHRAVAPRSGVHEGAGGFAMAAALAAIARGELDAALVVGHAPERGYALLLTAERSPDEPGSS